MTENPPLLLVAICPDTNGIVAAVSTYLAQQGCSIIDNRQYADSETGLFFTRIALLPAPDARDPRDALAEGFIPIASRFGMTWSIDIAGARPRALIAVSKTGHCLNDLLHRWSTGALPIDITRVVSNHETMRPLVEWHGIPFLHLPSGSRNRADQESAFLEAIDSDGTELVILARYMQILSDSVCDRLAWRCINIHHGFLPSFKGARPYHQAHARGVKIIGATAHYVTRELDEGPIIEQDVERVDHGLSPADLVEIGRDIEARVLARAVKWHAEKRVLPNGSKTVVFR